MLRTPLPETVAAAEIIGRSDLQSFDGRSSRGRGLDAAVRCAHRQT
jgi:hypothetical protein